MIMVPVFSYNFTINSLFLIVREAISPIGSPRFIVTCRIRAQHTSLIYLVRVVVWLRECCLLSSQFAEFGWNNMGILLRISHLAGLSHPYGHFLIKKMQKVVITADSHYSWIAMMKIRLLSSHNRFRCMLLCSRATITLKISLFRILQ